MNRGCEIPASRVVCLQRCDGLLEFKANGLIIYLGMIFPIAKISGTLRDVGLTHGLGTKRVSVMAMNSMSYSSQSSRDLLQMSKVSFDMLRVVLETSSEHLPA